jgi:SHS2 domain-containing protein
MPYRYLEDIAIADIAFEAWGETPEEMMTAAWDATLHVMVRNCDAVADRERRKFRVADAEMDMLLFQALQELVYFKDAENLLLRIRKILLERREGVWTADVETAGETIDPAKHDLAVDVKAVTLYRFRVWQFDGAWRATVVVDV